MSRFDLVRGASKSCGCLRSDTTAKRSTKHGDHGSFEYGCWLAMKQRCTDPNSPRFADYGARGITVCAEWLHDYAAFLRDLGRCPDGKGSLERIHNDRGYEPGNVVWADDREQANNKRNNRRITAFGKTLTLAQWARRAPSVPYDTLRSRLAYGWPPEQALAWPVLKSGNKRPPTLLPRMD